MTNLDYIIKELCTAKLDRFEAVKAYTNPSRRYWGISVKISGKIIFDCRGREYVHDENHVMILPRESSYSFRIIEPGDNILINFMVANEPKEREIFSVPITNPKALKAVAGRFIQLFPLSKPGGHKKGTAFVYELLSEIEAQSAVNYADISKLELIHPGVLYLENNFMQPELSSVAAAEKCGICEAYFRRLFKSIYRTTPSGYILAMRIERARVLLMGKCLSVEEAAERAGFSNMSYFYRQFKKSTGMSPARYSRAYTDAYL